MHNSSSKRVGNMKRILIAGFLGILTCSALPAAAQSNGESDAFLNQQREIENRIDAAIAEEGPITEKFKIDFGGSYSFNLFIFDDGVESSRTLRQHDLRLWTRMRFDQGTHEIYARTRLSYIDFNTGDSYIDNDNDWEGPNLDRGYYQFDLKRAMKAYAGKNINYNVKAKIGRDLVQIGTGLALWQTLDHVSVKTSCPYVELTGLAGKTVGSSYDFDASRPTDRTHRSFFAAQLRYLGFERHRPFAYVLWQRDHNSETFDTGWQKFNYDSFYAGVGSQGEIVDNLRYSTELVFESGHHYAQNRKLYDSPIRAWAFEFELEYLFDMPTHPRASAQYLFASGDVDRVDSPVDTVAGNINDTLDRGFNGFGYRNTGLCFAPRLSNLHMFRVGGAFFPFEGNEKLDRLELGTNWFAYWKHHHKAAVTDPTADVQSGYLGWEMDYYTNWAITNDLTWTIRCGVFFPGDSFSDQTTRTFALTGITWSF